ncbi:MAG: aldo/keto reductase [Bacteroidota bacterium]|nr:aldo/keto reductase [Bacteroidota bacterium]
MENSNFSRRKFIKGTGLLLAGTGLLPSCNIFRMSGSSSAYDAKGLPTAMLGKTGVRIPRIAIGLGSRFCTIESAEEAFNLLNYALDNGLYYWDTAWAYENKKLGFTSEERLGEVLKTRRKEIFISTKVTSRDPDEAMRQIEASLKRLQTDHVDMLKIHDIQSADMANLSKKGSLIDVISRLKEQGVTRFIGYSGHTEAEAMKFMAEKGIFDSMLMAMNHYNKATNPQERQEQAIPAAKTNDMGVMLMKVIRPRETIKELDPKDLVRYALSLKGPDGIVLGMDSLEVVKSNLEILRNFRPMDDSKMKEMAMQLTPFYNHENLPWMKSGYCDGNWA